MYKDMFLCQIDNMLLVRTVLLLPLTQKKSLGYITDLV